MSENGAHNTEKNDRTRTGPSLHSSKCNRSRAGPSQDSKNATEAAHVCLYAAPFATMTRRRPLLQQPCGVRGRWGHISALEIKTILPSHTTRAVRILKLLAHLLSVPQVVGIHREGAREPTKPTRNLRGGLEGAPQHRAREGPRAVDHSSPKVLRPLEQRLARQ